MEQIETQLMTVGRVVYPWMQMLIWHNPEETFDPSLGRGTRFRLVLVERGTGILLCSGYRYVITAPALFCLDENERPQLTQGQDMQAQALYFHPNVINQEFDFCNVRELDQSACWDNDKMWLSPFYLRNERWNGMAKLGPAAFSRISRLFTALSQELSLQRDYWPCRSRSFLLEILFLLERLYTLSDVAEIELHSNDTSLTSVEPVLLYLHNNYNQKLCLDGLARAFNTNRTTLTRQFHQSTGLPVMAYLNRLRINLAALMLRDTTLSVNEIVERIGLGNPTHFGRSFRKVIGVTPSEYRRKNCWVA